MFKIKLIKWTLFFISCLVLTQSVSAEQENEFTTNGKYIRLQTASKQLFSVYLAGPEGAKQGIVLIHGWFGLNKDVEAWADQFAMAGYRVMAVDLYNCNVATGSMKARRLMNAVKQTEANEKYSATLNALSMPGRKLAVIGWSYGASQALHATLSAPQRVSATVIYYPFGELINDKNMLRQIKGPMLGHFATHDFALTPDKVKQFTSTIKQSGVIMTAYMYDAKHGFDKPTGKNFSEDAHKSALDKTYKFLNKHMQ